MTDEVAGNADHVGVDSIVRVPGRQNRYRSDTKSVPFARIDADSVRTECYGGCPTGTNQSETIGIQVVSGGIGRMMTADSRALVVLP